MSVCTATDKHTTDCYTCLYAQPQTHILQTNIHMSVCPATDTQTTDCYNVCVHRHTNNRLLYMSVRAATHTTDRYTCLCAQPQTHIQQTAIHVCVHSHRQTYNRLLYMSVCTATDKHTIDRYTCLCAQPQTHIQQTAIHVCVQNQSCQLCTSNIPPSCFHSGRPQN